MCCLQVIDYELAESVFAKTKVSNVRSVNLWLGADVMVEYPLAEAKVRAGLRETAARLG